MQMLQVTTQYQRTMIGGKNKTFSHERTPQH